LTRQSIDATAIGTMVAVCMVLGVQQVALKSVAGDMSPVLQLAVRSGIAAVLVSVLMLFRRESFKVNDGTLLPGLTLGLLFSLEYLFLGEGLRFTSATRIVIFLYSAPLFTACILHFLQPEERLRPQQWLGIVIAFFGMALAFSVRDSELPETAANPMLGDLLGLLGGLAWALSTVVVRITRLGCLPASKTLWYQLVAAFVFLMAATAVLGQNEFQLSGALITNLLFQGVVVSFASFLVWLSLLRRYVASELGVLSFMTPVFGVAFGVFLLKEPVHPAFLAGALLLVTGIVLVSGHPFFKKRPGRAAS
jgi:drug/metabolite transporter (DMT)-like permease